MAETGRLAAWLGVGKGFEIREYPVPDPKPGAVLIKVALANVCGSDMHYWKGEQDMEKRGRKLPLNTGHEHMGTVAKLGAGVTTDSSGQPLREGDRVIYRYFLPCGRCRACLRRQTKSCPTRQSNWSVPCTAAIRPACSGIRKAMAALRTPVSTGVTSGRSPTASRACSIGRSMPVTRRTSSVIWLPAGRGLTSTSVGPCGVSRSSV